MEKTTSPHPESTGFLPQRLALLHWTHAPEGVIAWRPISDFLCGRSVNATSLYNCLIHFNATSAMPNIQQACPEIVPEIDAEVLLPGGPHVLPKGMKFDLHFFGLVNDLKKKIAAGLIPEQSIRYLKVLIDARSDADINEFFACFGNIKFESLFITFHSRVVRDIPTRKKACTLLLQQAAKEPRVKYFNLVASNIELFDVDVAKTALQKLMGHVTKLILVAQPADLVEAADLIIQCHPTPQQLKSLFLDFEIGQWPDPEDETLVAWSTHWPGLVQSLLMSPLSLTSLCITSPTGYSFKVRDALDTFLKNHDLITIRFTGEPMPSSIGTCLMNACLARNRIQREQALLAAATSLATSLLSPHGLGAHDAATKLGQRIVNVAKDDPATASAVTRATKISARASKAAWAQLILDHGLDDIILQTVLLCLKEDIGGIANDIKNAFDILRNWFIDRLGEDADRHHEQVLKIIIDEMLFVMKLPMDRDGTPQQLVDVSKSPESVRITTQWIGSGFTQFVGDDAFDPPVSSGSQLLFEALFRLILSLLKGLRQHLRDGIDADAFRQLQSDLLSALREEILKPYLEQIYCECMGIGYPLRGMHPDEPHH